MIIAFSGKIGSGKSSVSKAVAQSMGWARVSFGDYVRQVAQQQNLGDSRQVLQDLGEHLFENDALVFCMAVLGQAPADCSGIVVDGIRHTLVLDIIKKLAQPQRLVHIHITLDEEEREDRIKFREGIQSELELERMDNHSTEIQVYKTLPQIADMTVDSADNIDKIVENISEWLKKENKLHLI